MMDPIALRLSDIKKVSPELSDAAGIYEAILPILRDAELNVKPLTMTPEEVSLKISQGRPALDDMELELDLRALTALMKKLALAIEEAAGKNNGLPGKARRIRLAVEDGSLDTAGLLVHIASGESWPVDSMADRLQLDPALLWLIAQNALKPALRAWCLQLNDLSDGLKWDRGDCPVCGAVATLAEFQGNNQARHLRCGQCGADWPFSRMKCIYCGNDDHRSLSCFYPDDGHNSMRIEACDSCNGYLKVITSFTPASADMVPVEDLATLQLDYIAREHGYSRGEAVAPPRDFSL